MPKCPPRIFTVRWYEQYELTGIRAKDEAEAIEKAKEKISKEGNANVGEHLDTFDFHAQEE